MGVIEVDHLVKNYGSFQAVKDVSFTVNKGEVLGMLGPNGAGKSTTIRSICGYVKANGGDIRVNGVSIHDDMATIKRSIGYLPESAPLYSEMIVYDYLRYIGEVRQVGSLDKRIKELADSCSLREKMHFKISELSKGYKQRVGLAQAMISNPDILILDEPTSGLDPNQIVEIRKLIKEIGKEKTVILSTHILSEVEASCDRVVIISGGRVVGNGTTDELKNTTEVQPLVEIELAGPDLATVHSVFEKIDGVAKVIDGAVTGNTLSFSVLGKAGKDIRPALYQTIKAKDWGLYEFKQEAKSLESIFRKLTMEI